VNSKLGLVVVVQVTAGQMAIADIVMAPVQTARATNTAPAGFWKRHHK
jgi:hypothetical protein